MSNLLINKLREEKGALGIGFNGEIGPACEINEKLDATLGQQNGNTTARAISGTLHPLPYLTPGKYKVGQVLCQTYHSRTKKIQAEVPRYIAEQQLKKLEELGFHIYSSMEMEFLLVDPVSQTPVFSNVNQVFTGDSIDKFADVLLGITATLEAMGIGIEAMSTEYSEGQFELVLKPQIGIKLADNAFLVKDCVKAVARQHGLKAIFMTKKGTENNCNGTHFNHSLRAVGSKSKDSVFYDETKPDRLSRVLTEWLAGLVKHFPALTTLCCPTFNCYRRLNRPWAPSYSDWGIDNRMVCFRVKNEGPQHTYVENRLPSGSCNPYIVLAATVAAGIDGLTRALPCPKPVTLDMEKTLYDQNTESGNRYIEAETIPIPATLPAALSALQQDQVLVEQLGPTFIKWFVLLKELEVSKFKDSDITQSDEEMLRKENELYVDFL